MECIRRPCCHVRHLERDGSTVGLGYEIVTSEISFRVITKCRLLLILSFLIPATGLLYFHVKHISNYINIPQSFESSNVILKITHALYRVAVGSYILHISIYTRIKSNPAISQYYLS